MSWKVCLKEPNGRRAQGVDMGQDAWSPVPCIDTWLQDRIASAKWSGWMLYNDEPYGHEPNSGGGHCKGMVLWNDASLAWLIHSAPCWPCSFDGATVSPLDVKETHFGQSFIWLALPRSLLPEVMSQLALMQADVYQSVGTDFTPAKRAPAPAGRLKTIALADGIKHVAKHVKWGLDIYEDALCPQFGGSCVAETWLRPPCPATEHVVDAENLAWPGTGVTYHESEDHSKWACSTSDSPPWVAIGDINRMTSQHHRGGGAAVLTDPALWKLFSGLILSTKPRDPPHVARRQSS